MAVTFLAPWTAIAWSGDMDWTHHARDASRVSAIAADFSTVAGQNWSANQTQQGETIDFLPQSAAVVALDSVIAFGWVASEFCAVAIDRTSGTVRWTTAIDEPAAESWSSPAIDVLRGEAIFATGRSVRGIDLQTGATRWLVSTVNDIVNASPMIASLGPDRLFITDFGFSGNPGRLYCINLDEFDGSTNPFQPGHLMWSRAIGALSGASTALDGDRVVLATADGRVLAFDARATSSPTPIWEAINPTGLGFFGGIAVRDGCAYAASYAFFGGLLSANLLKIDMATGSIVWSVASNRTDATPIPLSDGRILLSTGVHGFGTQPSLQLFLDAGSSATRVWDTALDGGPMLGFWTHTPIVLEADGHAWVAQPPPPSDPLGPMPRTLRIDLDRMPGDVEFVIETIEGGAITAASAAGDVVSVGAIGISSWNAPVEVCRADLNNDGALDIFDVFAFLNAFSLQHDSADWVDDGLFDFFDVIAFLGEFSEGCP